MANHYKVAIKGTAGPQEVINVLYFGRTDGADVDQTVTAYNDLFDAIEAQIIPPMLVAQTDAYRLRSLSLTVVNEDNVTVGSFPYERNQTGVGSLNAVIAGTSQTAVIALRCVPFQIGQATRVPRRSYLAFGPVASNHILETGEIVGAYLTYMQTIGTAIATFTAPVGTQPTDVVSTRVGVPNESAGLSAEGTVVLAVARPFISGRASRRTRPSGG